MSLTKIIAVVSFVMACAAPQLTAAGPIVASELAAVSSVHATELAGVVSAYKGLSALHQGLFMGLVDLYPKMHPLLSYISGASSASSASAYSGLFSTYHPVIAAKLALLSGPGSSYLSGRKLQQGAVASTVPAVSSQITAATQNANSPATSPSPDTPGAAATGMPGSPPSVSTPVGYTPQPVGGVLGAGIDYYNMLIQPASPPPLPPANLALKAALDARNAANFAALDKIFSSPSP
ncbi:MAG: hypothetical protein WDW36_008097 [Sanguina aurantia]